MNAGETVAPAATVTEAGVVAAGLLSVSFTTAPPGGAGPFNRTVPVVDWLPCMVAGDSVTVETRSGVTVKVAVTVTPL